MLSWELPPFHSGGLGIATKELAESLALQRVEVFLILPHKIRVKLKKVELLFAASSDQGRAVLLSPYGSNSREDRDDLFGLVLSFGRSVKEAVESIPPPNVIHAHDWLTIPAALSLKERWHRPLIFHVHTTEFDRSGGKKENLNSRVAKIEYEGLKEADLIIAVSNYTKEVIKDTYNIPAGKIRVVHNAINLQELMLPGEDKLKPLKRNRKLVIFVGRLTLHKGPDWFLRTAERVAAISPETIFLLAGRGEMSDRLVKLAGELGIADRVFFTGFLSSEQLAQLYRSADVLVMPSVSEPFGIAALEATGYGVPVVVSKKSGVGEVIQHCFKIDFWDTRAMADRIVNILRSDVLRSEMSTNALKILEDISWHETARRVVEIYEEL